MTAVQAGADYFHSSDDPNDVFAIEPTGTILHSNSGPRGPYEECGRREDGGSQRFRTVVVVDGQEREFTRDGQNVVLDGTIPLQRIPSPKATEKIETFRLAHALRREDKRTMIAIIGDRASPPSYITYVGAASNMRLAQATARAEGSVESWVYLAIVEFKIQIPARSTPRIVLPDGSTEMLIRLDPDDYLLERRSGTYRLVARQTADVS